MGSSVIINAPRLVYKLSFQKGEDKNSTTYRLLEVLKDNNNINAGEFKKQSRYYKILALMNL